MLGNKKILQELDKGNINIHIFTVDNLNPNSYDVTLGDWAIRRNTQSSIFNPGVAKDTPMFGEAINYHDKDLVIEPYESVLAHTKEIVGSEKYATLLKSRSTIARIGLDICASAGFGDVGYNNIWTLEIKNNTNDFIVLRPGMRVAQISFFDVKGVGEVYRGVYNYNSSINDMFCKIHKDNRLSYNEMLLSNWNPNSILPKVGPERMY